MSEKIYFELTWELPNPFYKADGCSKSVFALSAITFAAKIIPL